MGWNVMLKVLRRAGFVPLLVVAQVVFALVVLVNVGSMLATQMAPVLSPTGVPANEVLLTQSISGGQHPLSYARIQAAEQSVRAMPGVIAVSAGLGAPFAADGFGLRAQPTAEKSGHSTHADLFSGDHVVQALGLRIMRGRGFATDDYERGGFDKLMDGRVALITASLAQQLFPGGDSVGQSIWLTSGTHDKDDHPVQVIGVISNTLRSNVMNNGPEAMDNAIVLPFQADAMPQVAFMVRTKPMRRNAIMKRLPAVLTKALGITAKDAVTVHRYEDVRRDVMHSHKLMAWMLAAVLATVAIVVLLGIAGLSGFWMQTRLHSLGVRRALGATRRNILRDCQLENLLMVGSGVVIGLILGLLAAAWLRIHFALGTPSTGIWIAGVLLVLAFGQLAVLGPAMRAARVPPVVATRSV
jgi:putative ABC transport system permease protein